MNVAPHYSDLDQPYLADLNGIEYAPVFILGPHRSGTTLLYQLLAETGCFNVVQYYHVNRYDEILHNFHQGLTTTAQHELSETIQSLGMQSRAIDAIKVAPTLPEEYGFVLKRHKGLLYRPYLRSSNKAQFDELCRKVQVTSGQALPILLKNPWDYANLPYLQRAFPTAKFIVIHRDPIVTLNSKVKAVRRTMGALNPYSALLDRSYAQMFTSPMRQTMGQAMFPQVANVDIAMIAIDAMRNYRHVMQWLPKLHIPTIEIEYDSLCDSPESIIASILRFLGHDAHAAENIETEIARRPVKLLPALAQREQWLQRLFKQYLEYLAARQWKVVN